MEEFDDLIQQPDDSGLLDLSHRAWVTLDKAIWTWGQSLIVLNISFNNIEMLPPELGKLHLLRDIDASTNRIEEIPKEIGMCARIKRLKLNGNRLKTIPKEISGCRLLEEFILSENDLVRLPGTIGQLAVLRILKLQNNKLTQIPPELGDCLSLEDIDCTGNPNLTNIPEDLQRDTKLCIWLCQRAKRHRDNVIDLEDANAELEDLARQNDEERVHLNDEISKINREKKALLDERPGTYLKIKKASIHVSSKVCIIS